jgi:hypothetical protein
MSSYTEGGIHGKGGIPIKFNPRRDAEAVARPSSLVGSHDERCCAACLPHPKTVTFLRCNSFNPTDALKRLELQEDIKKQQQVDSMPTVVDGSRARNVITGGAASFWMVLHSPPDSSSLPFQSDCCA